MKALERELRERFGARVRCAMPLAELTSFRIGGPADLFVTVEDEAELMHAKAVGVSRGPAVLLPGRGDQSAGERSRDARVGSEARRWLRKNKN